MSATAKSSVLLLAMVACGAAEASPRTGAPVAAVAGASAQSEPPSWPSMVAPPSEIDAGRRSPAHVAEPAPASGLSPATHVGRPATISLSSGRGEPGDAELAAGDDAVERGDWSEAQRRYESARAAAPKSVGWIVGLARVRIARADVPLDYDAAKGNRDIVAVAQDLARAVKASPAYGPAFVELGRAELLVGDAAAALEALRRGAQLLPDEPEARSQLGVALLATGHAVDSVRELARAVELDPASGARHGNLGTALLMAGRTAEAIEQYEARARVADGDARAHSDLGTALLGTQDLERAVAELEKAVRLDPAHASYHSNLGFALQQAGRIGQAAAEYREALRLDANLVSAWINLATVLSRDPATRREARTDLVRAQALAPDDPRVSANLEELNALERGGDGHRAGDAGTR